MSEWQVDVPGGTPQKVAAAKMEVTQRGDLVFWDAEGACIRAFATSAWIGCEQVKKSVHYGYGRAA